MHILSLYSQYPEKKNLYFCADHGNIGTGMFGSNQTYQYNFWEEQWGFLSFMYQLGLVVVICLNTK